MTREEINTMKYKVCCPMCDNKKCVKGTDFCEAEQWAKSKAECADESSSENPSKWVSVKNSMPIDGSDVLFCDIYGDIHIGYHIGSEPRTHFVENGSWETIKDVVAWKALPTPYVESEGNEMIFEEKTEIVISQLRADRDRLQESLSRCIEIPDGVTNGDMIMAMFPNAKANAFVKEVGVKGLDTYSTFTKTWWNAPYKGGKE